MSPDQIVFKLFLSTRSKKFVIGMSFEKMADVNLTGYNAKMSGITNFTIKGTEGALDPNEQFMRFSATCFHRLFWN